MPAFAVAPALLMSVAPPLLSRCFARCYSAVPSLFSGLSRARKCK
jgi:hypothetical protein